MATAVAKALPYAGMAGIGASLLGNRTVGAKAIRVATLAHSQTYVPWEHIEDYLQT